MPANKTPKWLHRFTLCVYPEGTSLTVQSRDASTLPPILGRYIPAAADATEEGIWYEVDGRWQKQRGLRVSTVGSRVMRSVYREWIMLDIQSSKKGVALREDLMFAFHKRRKGKLDTSARTFSRHLAVLTKLGLVVREMRPDGKANYRMVQVADSTS